MAEEDDGTSPGRYIRLTDGSIYGYTDLLATRRDATIVDEYTAAQYMRAQGLDNDLTRKYPNTAELGAEMMEAIPAPTASLLREERIKAKLENDADRAEKQARIKKLYEKPDSSVSAETVEGPRDALDITEDPVVRELLGNVANRP
jgi:ABC-type amino acid transport substrate-binding protein